MVFAGMGNPWLAAVAQASLVASLAAQEDKEIEYTCADLRPLCDYCNSRVSIHEIGAPLYHWVCKDVDSCEIRRTKSIENGTIKIVPVRH